MPAKAGTQPPCRGDDFCEAHYDGVRASVIREALEKFLEERLTDPEEAAMRRRYEAIRGERLRAGGKAEEFRIGSSQPSGLAPQIKAGEQLQLSYNSASFALVLLRVGPYQLPIGEPPAADALHGALGPKLVLDPELAAVRVAEIELGEVAM